MHKLSKKTKMWQTSKKQKLNNFKVSTFKILKIFEEYKKVIGQQHSAFFCFVFFFFFLFSFLITFFFFFLIFVSFVDRLILFFAIFFYGLCFFVVSLFWPKTWICKSQKRALLVERSRPRWGEREEGSDVCDVDDASFRPSIAHLRLGIMCNMYWSCSSSTSWNICFLVGLTARVALEVTSAWQNPFLPASLSSPECSAHTFQTRIRTVSQRLCTAF